MGRFEEFPGLFLWQAGKGRHHARLIDRTRPAIEFLESREVPAGITVNYSVVNDWGSGFQASLQIKNDSGAPIQDWKLEFDYASKINSIWESKLISQVGNHYTIGNAGWNATIPNGGSVTFGFTASPGANKNPPTNYILNGVRIDGSTPTPTLPSITVADASLAEGNSGATPMNFTVKLSAASTKTVSVNYNLTGSTATAGSDFTNTSGTLTFAPGETSKTLPVSILGDTVPEGDEAFKLNLTAPVNATLGTTAATGTILNDDQSAGTGSVRLVINNDWGSGFTATVTMTNNTAKAMTNWKLEFDFDGTINSLWDARQVSRVGNHWIFTDNIWNNTIPANGSVSFGFVASPGKLMPKPINLFWTGTPIDTNPGTPPPASNQPPKAVNDSVFYTPGTPQTIQPLVNDSDPENDPLKITQVGNATNGKVVLNADSSVIYTANPGFKGQDSFTYTVSDGKGNSASATVTVNALTEGVKVWPAKVFAPYVDVGLYPTFDMVSVAKNQGVKFFSLGFITADTTKQPAWGGYKEYAITGTPFDMAMRDQVRQIRGLGGDVTISFGGASNQEIAEVITDITALKNAYSQVADAYGLTRLDFDIEGGALAHRTSVDRRSAALALLQKEREAAGKPTEIWLTLPVLPTGLTADGLYSVNSMLKAGVRLGGVNIMAMDYGDSAAPNPQGKMGDYAIQAATSTFNQLKAIYGTALTDAKLWSMVGVTPMIGLNDVTTEVFDQQEARELLAFAQQKNMGLISFWSLNRDFQNERGVLNYVDLKSSSILQSPYEFSNIFKGYTSSGSGGGGTNPVLPSLSVSAASVTEGNSGLVNLDFQVKLSAASSQVVSFTVNTADQTALSGTDYNPLLNQSVSIAAGQTEATVRVQVKGDTAVESNETLTLILSAATGATIATAQATGTIVNDDTAPGGGGTTPAGKRVVSYFAEWGIYDRNFTVADLPISKLTTINYAFAKITDSGEVGLFDSWAAVEKPFGTDTWDTPLRGNFGQLKKLKAANPQLEILIAIGGWTLSDKFSDVALTPESRAKFAKSCVDFCAKYGFDGVDLDWEYPVSGGLPGNVYRPEDKQNYTHLVKEIRRQFDLAEAIDGKNRLITIAAPAGFDKMANYELASMSQYVDWMNLMTYDYHGAWEKTTNHNAPLYANPNNPSSLRNQYTISYTVDAYLQAGVPADKLILGAPLYGRSWAGVGNTNNGLFQSATGAGRGTWEAGVVDYFDLRNKLQNQPSVYQYHWDDQAKVPYVYAPSIDGGWFSTYEDTRSLDIKIDYLLSKGMGGMMFWEADADVRDANSPNSLTGLAAKRLLGK